MGGVNGRCEWELWTRWTVIERNVLEANGPEVQGCRTGAACLRTDPFAANGSTRCLVNVKYDEVKQSSEDDLGERIPRL